MDVAPTVLALAGLDEFGLIRAPDSVSRGIIYKHTARDAFEYIRSNDVPFRERDGIRAYHIETTSYNWRNILVFLAAKDCARLKGEPYAMFSDHKGESTRFDFNGAQADAHALEGRCGRLLSFYVSYKFDTKKLRVGIKKPGRIKWEVSLKP